MNMKIFFSESEMQFEDFDFYLILLKKALNGYFRVTPFSKLNVQVYKGVSDEAQEEKACNKGVCKQRRNKTVNASKSS